MFLKVPDAETAVNSIGLITNTPYSWYHNRSRNFFLSTADQNEATISVDATVNGVKGANLTTPSTTSWSFNAITLILSFESWQNTLHFTGDATIEITIPPDHTHLTVNGVETHIGLPDLTTILCLALN